MPNGKRVRIARVRGYNLDDAGGRDQAGRDET